MNGPNIQLKSAVSNKKPSQFDSNRNLAERIYRVQVIKQLIKERHMAHGAEEYNRSKFSKITKNEDRIL